MKTLSVIALVLLVFGAATLFAAPEEEDEFTLGLGEPFEVGAETAAVLERALGRSAKKEKEAPWQARVDATFLRIDAAQADEILKGHRPDEMGTPRPIPEALARRLVAGARGAGAIRPEPPPPLVLYDGQSGRLSATGRHTYLQDYDVNVGVSGPVYIPFVGQLADGTRLDLTLRRDGRQLSLEVDAAWAELVRPVTRFEMPGPSSVEAPTIELPEMHLFRVKKTVALPAAGGFLLAGGGRALDGASLRVVVLQVKAVKR